MRGTRWMYPRWATTKIYSKPLYDVTGKGCWLDHSERSRQISRRSLRLGDGAGSGPLSEGWVNGGTGREDRDGEEALLMEERQIGESNFRVEAMPFRRVSRWSKAVARDRGGNLRTSLGVSRAIPWIYSRERAQRKVEIGGEPKQR